jgi:hypothetical protein
VVGQTISTDLFGKFAAFDWYFCKRILRKGLDQAAAARQLIPGAHRWVFAASRHIPTILDAKMG